MSDITQEPERDSRTGGLKTPPVPVTFSTIFWAVFLALCAFALTAIFVEAFIGWANGLGYQ